MHFGNDRIISCHFPTNWPSRSPDDNQCDFWLWGYLKHAVVSGSIANLAELMTRTAQNIHNINTYKLRSVAEHAISRLGLAEENGGEHVEHFLSQPWWIGIQLKCQNCRMT
ncbi:hypothetical protein AVEN_123872-1 [Araneus ventricosus]|uniref:Uncharacterized protein n=1 Tax=Araneus ventricosus TaxID=182803 RepID=A0A4Y2GEC8_ARAVE|nr:hypothetical protein AVEN_123872-1 [Araneus ventricosus]